MIKYIYIYICYLWRVDIKPHDNISKQTQQNNLFFPSMWSIFCRFWANELEHNLRSITDYLSPSAGLKFADVLNGLAAISKCQPSGFRSGWFWWSGWPFFDSSTTALLPLWFFNHRLVAFLILQPPPLVVLGIALTQSNVVMPCGCLNLTLTWLDGP